jgi:hypothetical protein
MLARSFMAGRSHSQPRTPVRGSARSKAGAAVSYSLISLTKPKTVLHPARNQVMMIAPNLTCPTSEM